MRHGLGDCVTILPLVKALRWYFPDAYIALLLRNRASREIFDHAQIKINAYYYFSLRGQSLLENLQTIYKIHRYCYDYAFMSFITSPEKGRLFFTLLGPKQVFCENRRGLSLQEIDRHKHFIDRNCDLGLSLGLSIRDRQPHLYVTEADYIAYHKILPDKPLLILNIGQGDANRYKGKTVHPRSWPAPYMHKLALRLAQSEVNLILMGAALEKNLLSIYQDILGYRNVANFVGKTTVGQSMYLLQQADLSIGIDTGMQHIADALGKRTLSIFGSTNPMTHGAYSDKAVFVEASPRLDCQYCFTTETYYTCNHRCCMSQITVEIVYNRIMSLIGLENEEL